MADTHNETIWNPSRGVSRCLLSKFLFPCPLQVKLTVTSQTLIAGPTLKISSALEP
jgi:hypothetical protein